MQLQGIFSETRGSGRAVFVTIDHSAGNGVVLYKESTGPFGPFRRVRLEIIERTLDMVEKTVAWTIKNSEFTLYLKAEYSSKVEAYIIVEVTLDGNATREYVDYVITFFRGVPTSVECAFLDLAPASAIEQPGKGGIDIVTAAAWL